MLQHEGKFEMPSTATSGINKNKKPYTQWKHKIGGRLFSSFKTVDELGLVDGNSYIVAYEESPNSTYPENPYKNLKNVTPAKSDGVTKEEMKEEDEKVNKVDVGKPTDPTQEEWNTINKTKQLNIDTSTVFNQTCNSILSDKDFTFDKHFDSVYEKLWKLLQEKRKEKLK